MGGILAFLLQNKSLVVIVLLLIALAGSGVYAKVLKSDVEKCEAEKRELSAKLDISQASVKSLQESLNEQNAAVEKLNTDAAKRQLANAEVIAQAKSVANVYKKRADDLMKATPLAGLSKCDSASQLIDREIQVGK